MLRCRAEPSRPPSRSIAAKVLQRLRLRDAVFRHLTRAAAITVLVILSGIIISLVYGSLPALRTFGFGFLYRESGTR